MTFCLLVGMLVVYAVIFSEFIVTECRLVVIACVTVSDVLKLVG